MRHSDLSFRFITRRLRVICLLVLVPTSAWAGTGSVANLPVAGKKVTTGLNLSIDTHWVDGNGYRPVRIRVAPLGGGPAPADRTLDIKLTPHSWQWGRPMSGVRTTIELEQGNNSGFKTIAVPQCQSWGSLEIETFEDGRRREDLCEQVGLQWTSNIGWSEAAPTILFVDQDMLLGGPGARFTGFARTIGSNAKGKKKEKEPQKLPDVRAIASLFIPDNNTSGLTVSDFDLSDDIDDNDTLRIVSQIGRINIIRHDALPEEWLQLTAVDMIFVSMVDLVGISKSEAQWQALRTWLSTGSTLCVYDVGESFGSIPELERLFDLDPEADIGDGEVASQETIDQVLKRGWRAPPVANYSKEVHATRGVEWNNQWYIQPNAVNATPKNRTKKSGLKPDNPRPFLLRSVEDGTLVAFSSENPFPGKREEWCWLFNTLNNQDWMWYQRHGLSFHRENPQYWNLLIPGVGDAPVASFLVLISLFVIVIGPVNYFMLGRRRKLYLLLLTVPLGAGIVTTALFTYAVVNDGLGVRVRARTLTKIDQRSGRTISWSRQSYYAGLAPSAGMLYPSDAAIYPIDHHPTGNYGQPKEFGRQTRWSDDQRLSQGYLNSRSTSQLIVVESRATELGIDVEEPDGEASTPRISNRLGVDIVQLLLCGSDGSTFSCSELPADGSVQLHKVQGEEFEERWGKLFAANRPQYPVGFDPDQVENVSAIFGNDYSWWRTVDRGLPDPTTRTSILERGIRNIGAIELKKMKPKSYFAIVRTGPNVSLGVDGVSEEGSFHVVSGTY